MYNVDGNNKTSPWLQHGAIFSQLTLWMSSYFTRAELCRQLQCSPKYLVQQQQQQQCKNKHHELQQTVGHLMQSSAATSHIYMYINHPETTTIYHNSVSSLQHSRITSGVEVEYSVLPMWTTRVKYSGSYIVHSQCQHRHHIFSKTSTASQPYFPQMHRYKIQ